MAEKNSLWKNVREKAKKNRASGATPKEPTKEMLRQERKIKAKKYAIGGPVNTLEGDLISKVIMNRNKDKDFVQRVYAVVGATATGAVGAKMLEDSQPEQQAYGGYINPYMYYAGGPMEYGRGGNFLKHVGAGAYSLGEGILDTVTMGATDQLTDKGFEGLTKLGNKNMDLSDPANAKFLRTQQQIKGYGNTTAAVATGIATGNVQGAVSQGAKGFNTAFQATEGLSDDFKKWSNISNTAIGIGAGLAGGSFNTEGASASASEAAGKIGEIGGKVSPYVNQAVSMFGSNSQPMWQQAQAQQDLLNSPEYGAQQSFNNQQYVNQGLSFSHGGNITNNSVNLQSMKGRYSNYKNRYAKGGTFNQYGIDMIPDSAGLHHENAYGGVPIGPNALGEGGEIKMDTLDDGQYMVSDQVDGTESQKDFTFSKGGKYKELNGTLADGMKQELDKYSFGSLSTNSKLKSDLRRPNDSYAQSTIDQIKQKWQQKTEFARQRSQQEQAIVQAQQQKQLIEEEYIAAYGGRINPKKYPGLNMPKKSKGGYVYNAMTQPMLAHGGPLVSNVQQPFNGPAAQNRGGMMMARGGMMNPEEQMMQQQGMIARGGMMYATGGPGDEYYTSGFIPTDVIANKNANKTSIVEDNYGPIIPNNTIPKENAKTLDLIQPIQPIQSKYTPFTNNEMPGIIGKVSNIPPLEGLSSPQTYPDLLPPQGPYNPYGEYGFYGKDADGNDVSINPNMTNQYQTGQFTPEGYTPSSNKGFFSKAADILKGKSGADALVAAGQLAGPLSQFFQKKPEPFQYNKASATTLDPTTAIILSNEEQRRAQDTAGYNIKQNAPTSGSYLSNMRALGLGAGKQRGSTAAGIRQQYDVNNAGILNQFEQFNTGIENANIDAMQQDQANFQEQRTNTLYNAGANIAGMRKDYKTNEINQIIANNIGTSNYKYDPVNQTITYRASNGEMVTAPAASVIGTNPTNLGTGEIQQPGTPQFQNSFNSRLNQGFRDRFKGINSGK